MVSSDLHKLLHLPEPERSYSLGCYCASDYSRQFQSEWDLRSNFSIYFLLDNSLLAISIFGNGNESEHISFLNLHLAFLWPQSV